jgi:hypothetical protein
MRRLALPLLVPVGLLLLSTTGAAHPPGPGSPEAPGLQDASIPTRSVGKVSHTGLMRVAAQDTTYFGGTVWAPDSMRWEAVQGGVWTFDSGVGSSFDYGLPGVDPYKYGSPRNPAPPGRELHALMEGWVGIDNTYSHVTYFRRLSVSDFPGTACVGSPAGLGGDASLWCGVLPSEAAALCYAVQGPGYGNNWFVCFTKTFATAGGDTVAFSFRYYTDTEANFDYGLVLIDTTGTGAAPDVEIVRYTGTIPASSTSFQLVPGLEMRTGAGSYTLKFCVSSDGAYSDEDGFYTSSCGAFAVDDVHVTGGGVDDFEDFETGDGGWTLQTPVPGMGGDWSDLASLGDLPAIADPCACAISDSVLVFFDPRDGLHSLLQDNIAASPWIDLTRTGSTRRPGKFVEFQGYFELPLKNYIFVQINLQWYPEVCGAGGNLVVSPFTSDGYVRYFGNSPTCRDDADPVRIDFSAVTPLDAEQIRIGLGAINYCQFYSDCYGIPNTTPWLDNVRLGLYGSPLAPFITVTDNHLPQDAFPASGLLRLNNPGRMDCNTVKGFSSPEPRSELGDTLVVDGGKNGAEVRVQFAVRPGPGIDGNRLDQWLSNQQPEGTWRGFEWYSARMDTAEEGGVLKAGHWMTAYEEEDPNFTGSDTDRDMSSSEIDPLNHHSRLANDIFPDDLFTPGTRLMLFFKAAYLPTSPYYVQAGTWYTLPDTTGGNSYEMEVLPSSMVDDETWNCILYVNKAPDPAARTTFESALADVYSPVPRNFESTAWDRYDVRGPSLDQASLGRPLSSEYGATTSELMGYAFVLFQTGTLNAVNISMEDANILSPFVTLGLSSRPGIGFNRWGLYLTGDGIAQSVEQNVPGEGTTPLFFLQRDCGADYVCGTVRDATCGATGVVDSSACLDLDPVSGARAANGLTRSSVHHAAGNGCPQFRSFDLLDRDESAPGPPRGDEQYVGSFKTEPYASITNLAGRYSFADSGRTVVEGVSVDERRGQNCTGVSAVEERLREVLAYLGSTPQDPCPTYLIPTGVPGPELRPGFTTALLGVSPNPVLAAEPARITFTLSGAIPARVDVYDLAGRHVATVFDTKGHEGRNEAAWDLRDDSGRAVAAGVYFYRLRAGGLTFSKRLVVVRPVR